MKARTRGLAPMLTVAILAFLAACATARIAQQSNDKPVSQPPAPADEDFDVAPLPPGPEVVEGYDASAITSNLGDAIPASTLDAFVRRGPQYPLRLVQVQPSFDAGRFQGFEVVSVSQAGHEVFGDAIRAGDVVLKVNSHSIGRPESYMAAWSSLQECSTVEVELVRDGQTVVKSWAVQRTAVDAQTSSAVAPARRTGG